MRNLKGSNNPMWKGGLPKCVDCGKQLHRYRSKRCYSCNTKNNHKIKLYPYKKTGINFAKCIVCGVQRNNYIKRKCQSCANTGKNNPNYIHGQGRGQYNLQFRPKLKQEIRKRDNFICQCCGLKESDNKRGVKQINLTTHHIDYNKENCKKDNLISVCIGCNSKVNFNRDYWYAYFIYVMENNG
jgi:hypothetical protein